MATEKKRLEAAGGGRDGNESSAAYTPATQHFQVCGILAETLLQSLATRKIITHRLWLRLAGCRAERARL